MKGGCPIRWRSVLLTASSALALASCGGEGEQQVEQRTVTGPTIERALAERLATRSDKVASLLDSGDACGAQAEAARLRRDLTAAVGEIPPLYLEDLSGAVNELQAAIPCEFVPPPGYDDDKQNGGDEDEGDD